MRWNSFAPYVPVAKRRAQAALALAKLNKKTGHSAAPVLLETRKIASSFWGKAWCDNLEAYSDFENRLPRGRTYVRNGSVVDLQISQGKVTARVAGSSLYKIDIKIRPLAESLWKSIQTECAGKIDSLIELLQGRLSSSVMQIVTRLEGGLFPKPNEIELDCSCPDWADLCKHVAASLYGVGARLDQRPELLFLLRGVDPADLISKATAADAVRQAGAPTDAPALTDTELTDVFGIELAGVPPPAKSAFSTHKPVDPPSPTLKKAPRTTKKASPPKKVPKRIPSPRAKVKTLAKTGKKKPKPPTKRRQIEGPLPKPQSQLAQKPLRKK